MKRKSEKEILRQQLEQPREPKFYPANKEINIHINVDSTPLDSALEKANQLVEKLKEAESIANSLSI